MLFLIVFNASWLIKMNVVKDSKLYGVFIVFALIPSDFVDNLIHSKAHLYSERILCHRNSNHASTRIQIDKSAIFILCLNFINKLYNIKALSLIKISHALVFAGFFFIAPISSPFQRFFFVENEMATHNLFETKFKVRPTKCIHFSHIHTPRKSITFEYMHRKQTEILSILSFFLSFSVLLCRELGNLEWNLVFLCTEFLILLICIF